MNEDDFRRQLHKLTTPEASESVRARARHRALIAFQLPGSNREERTGIKGLIWNWRTAVGMAVIVSVLPFFAPPHPAPINLANSTTHVIKHPASENLASDRQILQQMEKLFPKQINAVVEENGRVDLSIAQAPVVGSDQPVLVVFKRGQESIRVLSYSGHRVCLMLGKTQNCFEILATPTGGIILEGEDKVWLASENPEVAGYSVRAQTLEARL